MFYCDPCRRKNDWPRSAARWRGLCEVCGEFCEDMNDIPSRALPDPTYKDVPPTAALEGTQEKK